MSYQLNSSDLNAVAIFVVIINRFIVFELSLEEPDLVLKQLDDNSLDKVINLIW